MTTSQANHTARIRELNDAFRTSFAGGRVMLTASVDALPSDVKAMAIRKVATFDAFDGDNDPHGEHDFGAFDLAGHKVFWKIDAYDQGLPVRIGRPGRSGEDHPRPHHHAGGGLLMQNTTAPTFMLQNWSVQRRAKGWYIAKPTTRFDKERPKWRGPYSSATSVSLMIARELKKEILRRDRSAANA